MNKINESEKSFLLKVDPVKFISELEFGYLFNNFLEKDLYLQSGFNYNFGTKPNPFNNITIIGIYNIITNIISIFTFEFLNAKHKLEFTSNRKPFDLYKSVSFTIECENICYGYDKDENSFIYTFESMSLKDTINTAGIGIYEHNIIINNINQNDFLRDCLFLYEDMASAIINKI